MIEFVVVVVRVRTSSASVDPRNEKGRPASRGAAFPEVPGKGPHQPTNAVMRPAQVSSAIRAPVAAFRVLSMSIFRIVFMVVFLVSYLGAECPVDEWNILQVRWC